MTGWEVVLLGLLILSNIFWYFFFTAYRDVVARKWRERDIEDGS